MEIQAVFAGNMKKYRKLAKITQEKLAELCNTDYRYIGQIETGRRCPSLEFIGKIAAALNIAPYLLFYDEIGAENEGLAVLQREQKQKIKTMLIENVSKICSMIDERY
jgi:transcriptional regulator with XRE-family HTH domain